MAQFCTKCGNQIPEGMSFCTGCGSTVGQPSAPAFPSSPTPIPPQQGAAALSADYSPVQAAYAPAPAAKPGSPVVKIVLIVVAVIIFFMLLAAASCAYVFYRAKQRVNQFEKQARLNFPVPAGAGQPPSTPITPTETPGAAPGQGTTPSADISALSYPGAAAGEGGNQAIGFGGVKLLQYTTGDSVDAVVAYYKGKLGVGAIVTPTGNGAVVQIVGSNGVISVTIAPDTASGKTKITVSSIGR